MPYACRRPHLPDNAYAIMQVDPLVGPAAAERVMTLFGLPPALPFEGQRAVRAYERFLARVAPRDDGGHDIYSGPRPRTGLPFITIEGTAYNVVVLNRMRLGLPYEGDEWLRTCAVFDCITPAHFTKPEPRAVRPEEFYYGYIQAWSVANPPRFSTSRPKSWRYSDADPLQALCSWGHPLAVYNALRHSAYCATCRRLEHERTEAMQALSRRLRAHGPMPEDDAMLRKWRESEAHAAMIASELADQRHADARAALKHTRTLSDQLLEMVGELPDSEGLT